MTQFHRLIALFATTLLWAAAGAAAPVEYTLDVDESRVQYRVPFGNSEIFGTMPVQSADIALDFEMASNSNVTVTLNAAGATASFPFAAATLKGATVLNTAEHPTLAFVTTAFRAQGNTAEIDGDITIRGVTRPVTLAGGLFREQGQVAGDRSKLLVRLTGTINRSEFGATGFPNAVGDRVEIEIIARINRAE